MLYLFLFQGEILGDIAYRGLYIVLSNEDVSKTFFKKENYHVSRHGKYNLELSNISTEELIKIIGEHDLLSKRKVEFKEYYTTLCSSNNYDKLNKFDECYRDLADYFSEIQYYGHPVRKF